MRRAVDNLKLSRPMGSWHRRYGAATGYTYVFPRLVNSGRRFGHDLGFLRGAKHKTVAARWSVMHAATGKVNERLNLERGLKRSDEFVVRATIAQETAVFCSPIRHISRLLLLSPRFNKSGTCSCTTVAQKIPNVFVRLPCITGFPPRSASAKIAIDGYRS
jgi:hypothetical protein